RTRSLAERAAEHLHASAVRADERGDLNAAKALLERGVDLSDGAVQPRSLVLLSEVLEELADYPAALDTATRSIAVAGGLGDRRSTVRAELVRIISQGQVDPAHTMAIAHGEATAALDEATRLGDVELRDQATLVLALLSFFQGRTGETVKILDELIDRAPTMSRRARQEIAGQLGISAYFGSLPLEDAFAALDRAYDLQGDSPSGEGQDLRVRAGLLGMAGRFEEAHAAVDRSVALFEELGTPMAVFVGNQATAETRRLEGRLDEAERLLREMHETYDSMGETGFNSTICGVLAQTLCDLGRYDEADAFAEKSRTLAAEDDFASQALWRMGRGRVLAASGAFEEALRLVDEAVAIMERTDYLVFQGDGHEVRGQVLAAAGLGHDARAAFEDALSRYERKGNVVAAARIRGRLAALDDSS
ncbi:MAG: tetratricopeptide repeat protein, partial [Actinobacteria bacterium]|nr:tetratricopeptide repeat protein [Actinomycetota bacterium]